MKNILVVLIYLCLNEQIIPQTNDETLAAFGDRTISIDEFKIRYELTPQMFREQGTRGSELKQEFLYTLIAEKLLSAYGESILLDTSEIVSHALESFEEMFIRDELYERMIIDKAKFKRDSLFDFYISNASIGRLTYIRTNSFEESHNICELLKKGTPFDFFRTDTSLSMEDTLTVTFGQFDKTTETEILTLPVNEFSKPLFLDNQWYVLNMVEKINPILERSYGWESEYRRLNKLAKERAEFDFYKDYMNKIFGNLNIKASSKLLKLFSEEVYDILSKKKLKIGEQKKYYLEASDLSLISEKISIENLNATFVNLPDKNISLKDYINFFRFENVSFDSINYTKILDVLNGKTRKFIEYKVLANEGYKIGLQNSERVRKQFKMWKQNYYYQLVTAQFADSSQVTDDEVREYYNQLNRGEFRIKEVNIVEVLMQDLETAEKVLTELEKGGDIKELASVYSIRSETANSKGEFGFKPITYFKEIGAILDKMKIGEIYGPTKVEDGYSIFKLIDVRVDSTSDLQSFDQVKKEWENELKHLKIKKSINEFIGKLAKQNNVSTNKELLTNIPTTAHNSVVFRLLGFGGKITAVPLISPNSEWVEYWLNDLKVIP